MGQWVVTIEIDDQVAQTIGRHVLGNENAPEALCRRTFAKAMPQFVARAVAARYAQALADRAGRRANDLANAVVTSYPEGFGPPVQTVPEAIQPPAPVLVEPPGATAELVEGPIAPPEADPDWEPDPMPSNPVIPDPAPDPSPVDPFPEVGHGAASADRTPRR